MTGNSAQVVVLDGRARRPIGDPKWYLFQRLRGSDQQAIDAFERCDIEHFYPFILELKPLPRRQMSSSQRKSGQRVMVPRKTALFPGYLFGRLDLDAVNWHRICDDRVGGLVCKDGQPVYMPDEVIASIKARSKNGAVASQDSVRVVFGVGDRVRVDSGPFAGFPGAVEEGLDVAIGDLDPSMRIRVAVDIFGRATPIDLEVWQVARP